MREIKFRTWTGDEFVYWGFGVGDSAGFAGPPSILGVGGLPVHKMVHEQFTGIHDSEGAPVYEGDIVNFTYWWFDGNEAESNLCGEIVYLPYCGSFGLQHVKNSDWCNYVGADTQVGDIDAFGVWRFEDYDFQIIGNIHENPERVRGEA